MGLPAEPRHQSVRGVVVAVSDEAPVGANGHREHRGPGSHVGKAALKNSVDIRSLLAGVVFDREQPGVEDRPQGAGLD